MLYYTASHDQEVRDPWRHCTVSHQTLEIYVAKALLLIYVYIQSILHPGSSNSFLFHQMHIHIPVHLLRHHRPPDPRSSWCLYYPVDWHKPTSLTIFILFQEQRSSHLKPGLYLFPEINLCTIGLWSRSTNRWSKCYYRLEADKKEAEPIGNYCQRVVAL